jgi:uncharacterized protein
MSQQENIRIAQELLAEMGEGRDPAVIADGFSEDVLFEIQGDEGVFPWIGRRRGRSAVPDFLHGIRSKTEPVRFDVTEILASDARAVIVGELATRVTATGKMIESDIAIILTVKDGLIARFQMLEDSFAVSRAARQVRRVESAQASFGAALIGQGAFADSLGKPSPSVAAIASLLPAWPWSARSPRRRSRRVASASQGPHGYARATGSTGRSP